MRSSSKELLILEKENLVAATSPFESSLLVCGRNSSASQFKASPSDKKLVTAPIPQSQVLGKVRDFLGVFSEANRQLQQDAKDNSKKYDIEALTGNESEVIEMELMLGVAELRNQQALAAAESALAGAQTVDGSSSESDSECSSDDDDDNGSDLENDEGSIGKDKNKEDASKLGRNVSKKHPKIIEIA